jgi:hypothetical protein
LPLLQLAAELRSWKDPGPSAALTPRRSAGRAATQLLPLRYPIRIGEHAQTAFAFSLVWDWARLTGDVEMQKLLLAKAREFYLPDRSCPLAYEPSGQDFLSPCLAEADFMRRVMAPESYERWLSSFLRKIPWSGSTKWLRPAEITDRSDPKLAHLDGLNLSRAWMLDGTALGLPPGDRRTALRATAQHRNAWGAVTSGHYEGSQARDFALGHAATQRVATYVRVRITPRPGRAPGGSASNITSTMTCARRHVLAVFSVRLRPVTRRRSATPVADAVAARGCASGTGRSAASRGGSRCGVKRRCACRCCGDERTRRC